MNAAASWHRPDREIMEYDVLIVGAGPAGLAAAIRLKQLSSALSVCVIEKGAEVGAHLLSGAALDPKALFELIPDALEKGAPLNTKAREDKFLLLTKNSALRLPTPPALDNTGNYIISLGELGRWLSQQAEGLGVEIYAGFAGAELLIDENGKVCGVATNDQGLDKHGQKTAGFAAGVELAAKQTIFAEGCRGSLTKKLFERFHLRKNCDPQTFGLGIKEVWELKPEKHESGLVLHSVGWPMDSETYGGSFVYHYGANLVAIGFVVGLDYKNPY
ncbi:MAG TPA: NAD(P)/FAD-dependent oxidoreductase, partial [Alphaproteobacteria bacterium]|nr:NAD(P)/FAD-dependent oxidoreductase [Alphaproteobacteria bacterium]